MHPREFQELMSAAILNRDPSNISSLSYRGAGTLHLNEAIEVYSSGYSARLFEALGETFETVWKVLGDEDFHALCLEYIRSHPSRSPNLSDYGEGFAEYIENHLPLDSSQKLLTDLARFERAFKECFHSPYEPPSEIPDLRNTDPENLRFTIMKSLIVIRVEYPVYKLHGVSGNLGQFNKVLEDRSQIYLALYRTLSGVKSAEVSELLWNFLRSVKNFCFDLDLLAEHCRFDPARVQRILHEIAKAGFLTKVEAGATP